MTACAVRQRLAELRAVEFSLDRVSALTVAGMDLSRLRSFDDLTAAQRETLATAARTGNVPVELELIVRARNPSINSTTAELFALDWLLLLNERETTTGKLDRRVQILPGREVELPLRARLNLVEFFGRDEHVLLDVLKASIGERGLPINLALRATPRVGTTYGPMGTSAPVVIARRVVASEF